MENNTALKLVVTSPQSPAIVRFWSAAYRRYRFPVANGLGFHVPEFPLPLVSPCFVTGDRDVFLRRNRGILPYFNEIVPLGHDQRGPAPSGFRLDKQFFLGVRTLARRPLPCGFATRVEPLSRAVQGEELWRFLEDGYPKDVAQLRTLLPFLSGLEADFRVLFLEEASRGTVGAVAFGVADGAAIVLNAMVREQERGRGFSPVLLDAAQTLAVDIGATEAFYWTENALFGRHADLFHHYRVFLRHEPIGS
jgi:hypothetical protein